MERKIMASLKRRTFLLGSAAGLAVAASRDFLGMDDLTHELQRGDPSLKEEALDYRQSRVNLLSSGGKGTLENRCPILGRSWSMK
jgi:hypothetical protein